MKKQLLTILSLSICLTVSAQTHKAKQVVKPDSIKKAKQYTLYFIVDSTQYVDITNRLKVLSNDIDGSNIPHDKEKEDQSFIFQLFKVFEAEKKAQDKQTDKK